MTTMGLLIGATAGAGLWILALGILASRPNLATELATLEAPIPAPVGSYPTWADTLTGWGLPGRRARADLAAISRTPQEYLATTARQVAIIATSTLAITFAMTWLGLGLGMFAPLWMIAASVAVTIVIARARLQSQAEATRRAYRHALSVYVDLVVIGLSGGSGVEQALGDAAASGKGPEFDDIRTCLDTAHLTRTPVWNHLAALGDRIGVTEYRQLSATVGLAGNEGARIRTSLTARATTLRAARQASAEAADSQATERMSLAIVTIFAGFLLFLGYPAVTTILIGL